MQVYSIGTYAFRLNLYMYVDGTNILKLGTPLKERVLFLPFCKIKYNYMYMIVLQRLRRTLKPHVYNVVF